MSSVGGKSSLHTCTIEKTGIDIYQYIGQAAYISDKPEAYSNPFYNTVPPGAFYPSLVFAILAAIVASQTMITATFQVCQLKYTLQKYL